MLFVIGKGLSFFRRYETQNEALLLQQAGQTPDRNHFVVMILSILQDILAGVRWVGGGGDMKRILLDFGGVLSQR
jgi:hypothetical protein